MIFCVSIFIFCLEPMVREQLDENGFRHYYGIFSKILCWNYLIPAMFKVLSQQLQGTLKTAFETYITVEDFTDMAIHELIFSWVNDFKRKSAYMPGKLSFTQ